MTGELTSRLLGGAAAVGALGISALAYSYAYERNAYTLRHAEVPVLPPGSKPLRLLHISDLHLDPSRTRMVRWVRGLSALDPDLVVATGDFFTSPASIPVVLEALEPLFATPGMFIPGNADYFTPVPKSPSRYITRRPKHGVPLPWHELAAELSGAGWLDLTNARSSSRWPARRSRRAASTTPTCARTDTTGSPARSAAARRCRWGSCTLPSRGSSTR